MRLWPAVKKINSDLTTPLDKLIGRLEKYNPGFAGATLDDCIVTTDGNIIISGVGDTGSTADIADPNATASHNVKSGLKITPKSSLGGIKIKLNSSVSGITTLYVVRAIDSAVLLKKDISSITPGVEFDVIVHLEKDINYYILVDAEGSSYTNRYNASASYPYNSTDINIISGYYNGSDNSSISYTFDYITAILDPLIGTVTENIAVSMLEKWHKLILNCTLPTNTSGTVVIKDTSDNILIASVNLSDGLNVIDLSSIDARDYKEIRVVIGLARVSTSDDTPEINYWEFSLIGEHVGYEEMKLYQVGSKGIYYSSVGVDAETAEIVSITGSGIVAHQRIYCYPNVYPPGCHIILNIDGEDMYLGEENTPTNHAVIVIAEQGYNALDNYDGTTTIIILDVPIKFNSNFSIRFKNTYSAAQNITASALVLYKK